MLGISSYFKDFDIDYIEQSINIGVKVIFMSLHIPEESYESMDEKLNLLFDIVKENEVSLMLDVSTKTIELLQLRDTLELLDLGVDTIRLDYGYSIEEIAELSKKFKIVLNGTTTNEKDIIQLKAAGVNLEKLVICHNFYPRKSTAIAKEQLIKMNKMFKKYDLKVQAFVTGDQRKRFPLFQGLPTLEKHRYLNPYIAMIELLKDCLVDDVIVGDSQVNLNTLEKMMNTFNSKELFIKAVLDTEYQYLYDKRLSLRSDSPIDLIRIKESVRDTSIEQKAILPRGYGAITIDNFLYQRYSGEMQIVLKDLEADERVNVIGYVDPYHLDLLKYLDINSCFKFVR